MTIGPEGFFEDQFEGEREEDTALKSAAREAGWALSSLVDEISFVKRQRVVNIINRLSAAIISPAVDVDPAPFAWAWFDPTGLEHFQRGDKPFDHAIPIYSERKNIKTLTLTPAARDTEGE